MHKTFLKYAWMAGLLLSLPSLSFADSFASIQYLEKDGRTTVETTGKNTSADTPFVIASIGKTMTAVAVLRFAERSKLYLDAPAAYYLDPKTAEAVPAVANISVRQLLIMSSGLPDYYDGEFVDKAQQDPDKYQTPRAAVDHIRGEPLSFAPGRSYEYSNTNYVLLGLILEHITGKDYATVIREEIFEPANMTGAFVFGFQPLPKAFPKGHEGFRHIRDYYEAQGFGDGGVICSAQDLARFYRALFERGHLLRPSTLAELRMDPLGVGYGMGIQVEGEYVGHGGADLGFSSNVVMNLKTGAIAIELAAKADRTTDWALEAVLN